VSLSSTIPTDSATTARPKFGLSAKSHHHHRTADFGEEINKKTILL
jgi:hypothetical protein